MILWTVWARSLSGWLWPSSGFLYLSSRKKGQLRVSFVPKTFTREGYLQGRFAGIFSVEHSETCMRVPPRGNLIWCDAI